MLAGREEHYTNAYRNQPWHVIAIQSALPSCKSLFTLAGCSRTRWKDRTVHRIPCPCHGVLLLLLQHVYATQRKGPELFCCMYKCLSPHSQGPDCHSASGHIRCRCYMRSQARLTALSHLPKLHWAAHAPQHCVTSCPFWSCAVVGYIHCHRPTSVHHP